MAISSRVNCWPLTPTPWESTGWAGLWKNPIPLLPRATWPTGGYLWNSGIFFWQAAALLQAVEKWQPELFRKLAALRFDEAGRPLLADYSQLDNLSIDYGVMEKHDHCAVAPLPCDVGWTDLGSWEAVHAVAQKDQDGNYLEGDILAQELPG